MNPDEYYLYRQIVMGFYATNPGGHQSAAYDATRIDPQAVDQITFDLWREGLLSHGDEEPGEVVPT